MIIKTRKLPATQTEPARMRATADNGATLTVAFPQYASDPSESVASALARAFEREHNLHRISDNRWEA